MQIIYCSVNYILVSRNPVTERIVSTAYKETHIFSLSCIQVSSIIYIIIILSYLAFQSLFTCKDLDELLVSNNQLQSLPANFGRCNKLVTLDITSNNITSIPNDQIDVLASIRNLLIGDNVMMKLPDDIIALYR